MDHLVKAHRLGGVKVYHTCPAADLDAFLEEQRRRQQPEAVRRQLQQQTRRKG